MNDVIEFLKTYIWKNGFEKLSEKPFDVYEAMVKRVIEQRDIDPKIARLVLVTLMTGTHEMAIQGCSAEEITRHIQSEHFMDKKTAKELTSLYLTLFNGANRKAWNDAEEAGFKKFCEKEWTVEWKGNCEWHTKHRSSYPCYAEASLMFAVDDSEKLHSHLSAELKSNPFLSEDDIYRILEKQIKSDLDDNMQEYCDSDDYYEPYFDEFVSEGTYESEGKWTSWGLEILEFTGSGDIVYER